MVKRVISPLTRLKISKALAGRKHTATHIRKIADAMTGKTQSKEHRDNISKAQKEAWKKRKQS